MLDPFANPHYLAGSVLARLAVNAATLLWSVIVVAKRDTLTSAGSAYAWIGEYVHEDALAAAFGALALVQTIWLLSHFPPMQIRGMRLCSVGYGVMAAGWSFVLFNIILGARPIQPTSTACVSVIVALALFAFVSNARGEGDGGGD